MEVKREGFMEVERNVRMKVVRKRCIEVYVDREEGIEGVKERLMEI